MNLEKGFTYQKNSGVPHSTAVERDVHKNTLIVCARSRREIIRFTDVLVKHDEWNWQNRQYSIL